MSWKGNRYRHSLASRGIKTNIYNNYRFINSYYSVINNPYVEERKVYGMNYEDFYLKDMEWEKEVDDTYENGVEEYVYHTTDAKNLESIMKIGLVSNFEQIWEESKICNYFSEYPAYSVKWYIRHLMASGKLNSKYDYEKESFIILRVSHKGLNLEEDYTGMTSDYGNSFCTEKNIKPNMIEIKTRDGWVPLVS